MQIYMRMYASPSLSLSLSLSLLLCIRIWGHLAFRGQLAVGAAKTEGSASYGRPSSTVQLLGVSRPPKHPQRIGLQKVLSHQPEAGLRGWGDWHGACGEAAPFEGQIGRDSSWIIQGWFVCSIDHSRSSHIHQHTQTYTCVHIALYA